MPASADVPDRFERQRKARAVRRALADIAPNNSKPQEQSSFFSKLPAEIRFLIFQLLLSQKHDQARPINFHSISPLYRPGHTHRTKSHTTILLTCRLIYYEARSILIKSATHHFRNLGSTSWAYEGDLWLHHMTKQRGADVYHLHDSLVVLYHSYLTRFFLPHLHWKRITWTICPYIWPPILSIHRRMDRLADALEGIELPASCQEVNLELEVRADGPEYRESLQQQADLCSQTGIIPRLDVYTGSTQSGYAQPLAGLRRSDGSVLLIDPNLSIQYSWMGSGQNRWDTRGRVGEEENVRYRTIRLCWRAKIPRREYMSFDCMDCLDLTNCEEMKRTKEDNVDQAGPTSG